MRVFQLRSRLIKKLPLHITIPREWIKKVQLKKGDVITFYIAETNELIIKKEDV